MKADTEIYYSIPEAAKTCGVSRTTLWKWVKSGKINAFITPGGHHRILREEMNRFLEENGTASSGKSAFSSILVVDDDPLVLEMFQLKLKGGGYRVETASDGFTAGIKLTQLDPDLVILDIFMDNMDGFEVCRMIRQNPELNHTRILALTGLDTPENQARIIREGADDYLPKTVDFKTVAQRIDALLGKSEGMA
jgi:excisionase family DNA binding protein